MFLLLSLIILRQLRICWYGAPSLTRSRVCSFSFCWESPAQTFASLSSTGLMSISHCLYFWDSPKPGGPGSRIYFPQEQDSRVTPPPETNSGRSLLYIFKHWPNGKHLFQRQLYCFVRVCCCYHLTITVAPPTKKVAYRAFFGYLWRLLFFNRYTTIIKPINSK
jgi:hypothetical protein